MVIVELETPQVRVEMPAMEAGYLIISVAAGAMIRPGDVIGHIDTGQSAADVGLLRPR